MPRVHTPYYVKAFDPTMDGRNHTAAEAEAAQRDRLAQNLEGEQVGRAGLSALTNPYPHGTPGSIGWLEGWAAGRQRIVATGDSWSI